MRSCLRWCVILVLVAACRRAPREPEAPPSPALPVAPAAEAARTPATAVGAAPGAGAAGDALAPSLLDRQAGGRPVSWWKDYLAKLRLSGPTPLFELAVARARANGLVVNVTEAAVTVDATAQRKAAAP